MCIRAQSRALTALFCSPRCAGSVRGFPSLIEARAHNSAQFYYLNFSFFFFALSCRFLSYSFFFYFCVHSVVVMLIFARPSVRSFFFHSFIRTFWLHVCTYMNCARDSTAVRSASFLWCFMGFVQIFCFVEWNYKLFKESIDDSYTEGLQWVKERSRSLCAPAIPFFQWG